MELNTSGIEELIVAAAEALASFDIKALELDFIAELLTKFAPIWNPIWAAVNNFLALYFNF